MLDNLTNDVIIQILSGLPVKLLMRLRCVSKRWCSLISSRDFIATHLNRALSNPQSPLYILLHCSNEVLEKDSFTLQYRIAVQERFTLHSSDERFPHNHFTKHLGYSSTDIRSLLLSLDREMDPSEFRLFLVGSSNGLICLTNNVWGNGGLYVLWNPTIQKAISLQVPDFGSSVRYNHSLGFGYDHKTDDYKLVILYNPKTDTRFQTVPPLVEIYTLRTGAWHSGKAPGRPYFMHCFSSLVFLNGALHWPAYTWGYQGAFRNVIVSFDLEDEGFREVAMPKSLQGVEHLNVKVALVDGLLALVPFNKWGSGKLHSVWVMKAYGLQESWTKLVDIDIWEEFDGEELDEVIGFTKNGEVLLTKDGRLFTYRPSTKETSYLQIGGVLESLSLDKYAESLVLLNVEQG